MFMAFSLDLVAYLIIVNTTLARNAGACGTRLAGSTRRSCLLDLLAFENRRGTCSRASDGIRSPPSTGNQAHKFVMLYAPFDYNFDGTVA